MKKRKDRLKRIGKQTKVYQLSNGKKVRICDLHSDELDKIIREHKATAKKSDIFLSLVTERLRRRALNE